MTDSDLDVSATASDPESDTGKNDNENRAETWFFDIVVCLLHDQTFSDLLKAREQQLGKCVGSASVIAWACSETRSEISGNLHFEGFLHDGSSEPPQTEFASSR